MFLKSTALMDETLEDGSERTVLKIPAVLAPVKAAILPLFKKRRLQKSLKKLLTILSGP
jgi:glycyl-tRNA synthetase